MHVDNSYILSFQLCIHCQHITALYSFQTGSGKLTSFFFTLLDWWSAALSLSFLPAHASSYMNTNWSYTVYYYRRWNKHPPTKTRCVFWNLANLLRACLIPKEKRKKKKDVRGFPAKTIGQLLIVKQDDMDNCLLLPRPSSTWPQTSLSRSGDFQFLLYTKICPPAEPLTYDSAVWEHLICNAWIRKLRGLKGK